MRYPVSYREQWLQRAERVAHGNSFEVWEHLVCAHDSLFEVWQHLACAHESTSPKHVLMKFWEKDGYLQVYKNVYSNK